MIASAAGRAAFLAGPGKARAGCHHAAKVCEQEEGRRRHDQRRSAHQPRRECVISARPPQRSLPGIAASAPAPIGRRSGELLRHGGGAGDLRAGRAGGQDDRRGPAGVTPSARAGRPDGITTIMPGLTSRAGRRFPGRLAPRIARKQNITYCAPNQAHRPAANERHIDGSGAVGIRPPPGRVGHSRCQTGRRRAAGMTFSKRDADDRPQEPGAWPERPIGGR